MLVTKLETQHSLADFYEDISLLGLISLERSSALIDIGHRRLIYPGPSGFDLKLSPGSTMMALERAESGHLLLPFLKFSSRHSV